MATKASAPAETSEGEPDDLAIAARGAGLRYVNDQMPGLERMRSGKGFRYRTANGEPVRDSQTLERIASLAIPPAWTDVWICASPHGHLQATGRDAKGRKQYRYHPCWREVRDETKYERLTTFARALPDIRTRVDADLRRHHLPQERVLATVIRLLETTLIRVGNESYARENRSYGLTTLRNRHVQIDGSHLRFRFSGKSGKTHRIAIADPRLARIVKRLRDLPGQTLFQYEGDDGTLHNVDSDDVNSYLEQITGKPFTAKDFRTWAGTVLAARELRAATPPQTEAEGARQIAAAIDVVAERLGNTRAVCRSAYVHPAILHGYLDGSLQEFRPGRAGRGALAQALDTDEHFTLAYLESVDASS